MRSVSTVMSGSYPFPIADEIVPRTDEIAQPDDDGLAGRRRERPVHHVFG